VNEKHDTIVRLYYK